MKKINRLFTAIIFLFFIGNSHAQLLDANQTQSAATATLLPGAGYDVAVQEFVAINTGSITSIEFQTDNVSQVPTLSLQVKTGNDINTAVANGNPVTFQPSVPFSVISVNTSGANINVVAGTRYWIEITTLTPSIPWDFGVHNPDSYPQGSYWFIFGGSPYTAAPDYDMHFAVYVTTGGSTTTQLSTTQCGLSVNGLGGSFYCNSVVGAQDYKFKFTGGGLPAAVQVARGGAWANILRSAIPGLAEGNTYNVQVRAKVGGVWQPYGPTCTVTINATTYPELNANDCNQTETTSGYLYCTAVDGATQYKFKVTGGDVPGGMKEIIRSGPYKNFLKSSVPMNDGQTYQVQVSAKVNGAWLPYNGTTCNVTIGSLIDTPEDLLRFAETAATEPTDFNFELDVYPNPSSGIFNLNVPQNITVENAFIDVMDINGKSVYNSKISSGLNTLDLTELANGMYFIRMNDGINDYFRKLVKE